jgi:hypothetical protein
MTNRGPIHDLLPGWEPWKPEDCGDVTYGGRAGCGGDATGISDFVSQLQAKLDSKLGSSAPDAPTLMDPQPNEDE